MPESYMAWYESMLESPVSADVVSAAQVISMEVSDTVPLAGAAI